MADMPTIFPMRFPSIPAARTPSSIDDLLPSTYMDRPTPFTGALQQIGKMLQARRDDADQAAEASLKFGPQAAPGQIEALSNYLFRRGGQPYGGVMNPEGTAVLQIPGAEPMTPFNTAGQVRAQTDAEQAAALEFKRQKEEEARRLAHEKLDQQQKQFETKTRQRGEELKEKAAYHEHTNARLVAFGKERLAKSLEGSPLKLAAAKSKQASQAFSNSRAAASQAAALEKTMANDFTMTPEVKAERQKALAQLHQQADDEMKRGYEFDAEASRYLDAAAGGSPAPAAPAQAPAAKFSYGGQNPRFPNAAYGTVDGVAGWYEKEGPGKYKKVE